MAWPPNPRELLEEVEEDDLPRTWPRRPARRCAAASATRSACRQVEPHHALAVDVEVELRVVGVQVVQHGVLLHPQDRRAADVVLEEPEHAVDPRLARDRAVVRVVLMLSPITRTQPSAVACGSSRRAAARRPSAHVEPTMSASLTKYAGGAKPRVLAMTLSVKRQSSRTLVLRHGRLLGREVALLNDAMRALGHERRGTRGMVASLERSRERRAGAREGGSRGGAAATARAVPREGKNRGARVSPAAKDGDEHRPRRCSERNALASYTSANVRARATVSTSGGSRARGGPAGPTVSNDAEVLPC